MEYRVVHLNESTWFSRFWCGRLYHNKNHRGSRWVVECYVSTRLGYWQDLPIDGNGDLAKPRLKWFKKKARAEEALALYLLKMSIQ